MNLPDHDLATIRDALDRLALALTGHDHFWTPLQREGYDKAIAILNRPKIPTETLVADAQLVTKETHRLHYQS